MTNSQSIKGRSLRLLLVALLALFGFVLAPSSASASSTDMSISDAKAAVANSKYSLAEAQSKLDAIEGQCEKLQDEIEELQLKVDDLAVQTVAAQQAMLEGREALGNAMQYNYRSDSLTAVLDIIFGAADWSEFSKGVDYMSAIMDKQAADVEEQKRLRSELEAVSSELTAQKDEQEGKLNELEQKRTEAEQVVSQVSEELAENSAALAELQEKAAAIAKAQEEAQKKAQAASASSGGVPMEPDGGNAGGAGDNPPSSNGGAASAGNSGGGQASSSPSASGSSGTNYADGAWRTGVASAYGGSSDPTTPNPGRTSTGAVCDDYSMGVAIPKSWPNYKSYLGRTVQISYGGKVVTAVVNDCGGMGGGSRSLDLQPGVFKSFGYDTCRAWGVRTVSYRFL